LIVDLCAAPSIRQTEKTVLARTIEAKVRFRTFSIAPDCKEATMRKLI
jgi:hypothetical protein